MGLDGSRVGVGVGTAFGADFTASDEPEAGFCVGWTDGLVSVFFSTEDGVPSVNGPEGTGVDGLACGKPGFGF